MDEQQKQAEQHELATVMAALVHEMRLLTKAIGDLTAELKASGAPRPHQP